MAIVQQQLLAGVRVLCVDDDLDWLQLLALILHRHGAVVTTMPSAELAIECLSRSVFEVVISDLAMPPGLDGYDLAHALRRLEREDASRMLTPTLAVSGDALRPSPKQRFADFQVYMAKPLDEQQLVNIVERLAEADGEAVNLGTLAKYDESKREPVKGVSPQGVGGRTEKSSSNLVDASDDSTLPRGVPAAFSGARSR